MRDILSAIEFPPIRLLAGAPRVGRRSPLGAALSALHPPWPVLRGDHLPDGPSQPRLRDRHQGPHHPAEPGQGNANSDFEIGIEDYLTQANGNANSRVRDPFAIDNTTVLLANILGPVPRELLHAISQYPLERL